MSNKAERDLARDALLASASTATPALSQFSNWLMGGLGAAFALLISNLDAVAKHVWPVSLRWALIWFAVSLLLGLVARLLSTSVVAGLATSSLIEQRVVSASPIDFDAFHRLYSSGLLLPYKCISWWSYRAVKRGDYLLGARYISKLSQWQAILTLLQIVFAAISILVLAAGVHGAKV